MIVTTRVLYQVILVSIFKQYIRYVKVNSGTLGGVEPGYMLR